ncbi:hypothetical protein K8089_02925 [Aequorivita sp. F47161]|uniref:Uncharacterized protein n=1 Tax=Aequorivita vitellina TaxID=2874475 RepID=A0A9X1QU17_9FLAO|nr:hypothetical protein [Aequorivita vitellina]MCG2417961.1 hypothetical protein [Aequorivita vitellina]
MKNTLLKSRGMFLREIGCEFLENGDMVLGKCKAFYVKRIRFKTHK